MTDRYAVMGHPVSHNKSPFIHARFAVQTGESLSYDVIAVEPGQFPSAVSVFREQDGKGLNITRSKWSPSNSSKRLARKHGGLPSSPTRARAFSWVRLAMTRLVGSSSNSAQAAESFYFLSHFRA